MKNAECELYILSICFKNHSLNIFYKIFSKLKYAGIKSSKTLKKKWNKIDFWNFSLPLSLVSNTIFIYCLFFKIYEYIFKDLWIFSLYWIMIRKFKMMFQFCILYSISIKLTNFSFPRYVQKHSIYFIFVKRKTTVS